jgi:phage terminase large subunit GpA-like protein
VTADAYATSEQYAWIAEQLAGLPTEIHALTPSAWAEQKRYLPPSVTSMPGYYRFDLAPYLREILDCLGVNSPVREVALMKGVQICATVGLFENFIGYAIEHVASAPMMLVTADKELATIRIESYILPMLQASGLSSLIQSTDEGNRRKTGKTASKLEWFGGGFLIPLGAQNADKLRSVSIQFLLRDEIDAYPDNVGKDGDPIKLSTDRTAAYETTRKIADLSTPTIRGHSKIEKRFQQGDQRRYFVRCLACAHPQVLRWRRVDPDTGVVSGITWQIDETGRLVTGSARYLCEHCGHAHRHEDKIKLLAPGNAEWRPTATARTPTLRSYHISALYSTFQSWEACVLAWLESWNDAENRPRDLEKLQVFYNNILGETYELRGEQLRFEKLSAHRRAAFHLGEVPNKFALEYCLGPILLLVCTVDVHKENLAVAVVGWAQERRAFLIEYARFEGDTEQLDDPGTWGRLRDLIENQVFIADDGKQYRIGLTLIDSGYRADHVYQFCSNYDSGVFPVKGRDEPKSAAIRSFTTFETPMGTTAIGITVDYYKDRWSAALKQSWNGQDPQPQGHFNAPIDTTDAQLKELTVEVKREKIDKATGKRIGFEWYRPSGAKNELWDLLVYAYAALDVLAWDHCLNQLQAESVNWGEFYKAALEQDLYFQSG